MTLPILLRLLPVGTTIIGPVAVDPGLHTILITLEVGVSMVAGQVIWIHFDLSDDDGTTWTTMSTVDFTGPGRDAVGPRTHVSFSTQFWQLDGARRIRDIGWQARAVITVEVGSVAITDGALVIT